MKYLCAIQTDKEKGASLVEYALLLALVALVCVAAVTTFGTKTSETYTDIEEQIFP